MEAVNYRSRSFDAMGTRVGLWIDRSAGPSAGAALGIGERFIGDFDRRLSRFRPESELCRLNCDPSEEVEVSTLMLRFVEAAIGAARLSGGLVDPTLTDELERAGYRNSRTEATAETAAIEVALEIAPEPRPARSNPQARWRSIEVDAARRTVRRPPGLRLDSGGSGKGLAADLLAGIWRRLLPRGTHFIIDCGGDIRLGDVGPEARPYAIAAETVPALPEPVTFELRGGGIATSGIGRRIWRGLDGYAHHLIDPASGRPAWTGVLSATALAPSALLAETTAKRALLGGPQAAARLLADDGGLFVDDAGAVHEFKPEEIEVEVFA